MLWYPKGNRNVRKDYVKGSNAQNKDNWSIFLFRTNLKWWSYKSLLRNCAIRKILVWPGSPIFSARRYSSTLHFWCLALFGYKTSVAFSWERFDSLAVNINNFDSFRFLYVGYVHVYVFSGQIKSPTHLKERIVQASAALAPETLENA